MFGDRIVFRATLRVVSDLHIGSLGSAMKTDNVNRLLYDSEERPLLPASTLKGVLRALTEECEAVFGTPTDSEQDGKKVSGIVAKLWFDDAPLAEPAEDIAFVGRGNRCGPGVFLADRVSIDRKTGAAEDNKLYQVETVAEGGRFELSGIWLDADDIGPLEAVFARLAAAVSVGRGTNRGNGRMALEAENLTLTREIVGEDGFSLSEPFGDDELRSVRRRIAAKAEVLPAPQPQRSVSLRLNAKGPYLSIREHRVEKEGGAKIAQPLEADGRPVLRPESLVGVLRERASWLAELDRARATEGAVSPDARSCDDRFRKGSRDLTSLTPVERLFGVVGWRARLRVSELSVPKENNPVPLTLTSVSIDRITGAGRDSFLYSERAFTGAAFDVTLAVEDDDPDTLAVFDRLIENIGTEGLELGHGTTKGFGWFEVTQREESA